MPSELDKLLNVQQTALRLREQRQGLLASNLANADTPGYKARDIPFSSALQQATQASQAKQSLTASKSLATTAAAHIPGKHTRVLNSTGSANGVPIQYRNDQQGRIDGNNVNADYERMQFTDNAMRFEITIASLTAQIRAMSTVIQP